MRKLMVSLAGLALAWPGVALAQETPPADERVAFGIRPVEAYTEDPASFGYFIRHLEPGERLVDEVLVANEGNVSVRLKLYAAEAETAINGGTSFGAQDPASTGVGSWISLAVGEVFLEQGEERIIPFTITVPADASPGEHLAGLIAEAAPDAAGAAAGAAENEAQFNVEVIRRAAVAVMVEVPGARLPALALTNLLMREQHDLGAVFEVSVHNQGNVMVEGEGALVITDPTDPTGAELASIPIRMDTILSGDASFFYVDHPLRLADGDYLLGATIEYRTVRGDQESRTAVISGVELEVRDGQPRIFIEARPADASPDVVLIGGAENLRSLVEQYGLYGALALAALALAGLLAIARRRRRTSA